MRLEPPGGTLQVIETPEHKGFGVAFQWLFMCVIFASRYKLVFLAPSRAILKTEAFPLSPPLAPGESRTLSLTLPDLASFGIYSVVSVLKDDFGFSIQEQTEKLISNPAPIPTQDPNFSVGDILLSLAPSPEFVVEGEEVAFAITLKNTTPMPFEGNLFIWPLIHSWTIREKISVSLQAGEEKSMIHTSTFSAAQTLAFGLYPKGLAPVDPSLGNTSSAGLFGAMALESSPIEIVPNAIPIQLTVNSQAFIAGDPVRFEAKLTNPQDPEMNVEVQAGALDPQGNIIFEKTQFETLPPATFILNVGRSPGSATFPFEFTLPQNAPQGKYKILKEGFS